MEYKVLPNLSRYRIYPNGEVYRHYKNKNALAKIYLNNNGYAAVTLTYDDGHRTTALVRRLVAEAFLPNPNNLTTVHHKDGNQMNLSVDNLCWTGLPVNIRTKIKIRRLTAVTKSEKHASI